MVSEDAFDEEDAVESSIFDLDHAPSPHTRQRQSSTSSLGALFAVRPRSASLSPRPPSDPSVRMGDYREAPFRTAALPRRLLRSSTPSARLTYGTVAESTMTRTESGDATRRRAYSATAAEVPAHALSQVRSFPPQYPASMGHRRSESLPMTTLDTMAVPPTIAEDAVPNDLLQLFPSSVDEGEETKEPILEEEEEELDHFRTEDRDIARPLAVVKLRADSATSDMGGSIFSTEVPPPSEHPDVYLQGLDRRDSNAEDYNSSTMAPAPTKPMVLCGCIRLPLWCSKRRISWNRTYGDLSLF
jgi:hypothetical protein